MESDGEGIGRDRWGKGVRWTWKRIGTTLTYDRVNEVG